MNCRGSVFRYENPFFFVNPDLNISKSRLLKMCRRDRREIAPLCQAEDAILVDSSDMSIPQVIDTIISEFKKIK